MVTAGAVEDLTTRLKLPEAPKILGEHFQKAALKGAVSVPANIALAGADPSKAFADTALSTAANTMGGFDATQLGNARLESMDFVSHKLAHGVVEAATEAILNLLDLRKDAAAVALGLLWRKRSNGVLSKI
jgi:hypothetical protein